MQDASLCEKHGAPRPVEVLVATVVLTQHHPPISEPRHYEATPDGLIPMPHPTMLKIVRYGDSEFNLLYCDDNGDWMNDTLHRSFQEAADCANDEFGVLPEEWTFLE